MKTGFKHPMTCSRKQISLAKIQILVSTFPSSPNYAVKGSVQSSAKLLLFGLETLCRDLMARPRPVQGRRSTSQKNAPAQSILNARARVHHYWRELYPERRRIAQFSFNFGVPRPGQAAKLDRTTTCNSTLIWMKWSWNLGGTLKLHWRSVSTAARRRRLAVPNESGSPRRGAGKKDIHKTRV